MVDNAIGARIYIGPANPTQGDVSAYAALSYVEIDDVATIGELGASISTGSFTRLKDGVIQYTKGARDNGNNFTITCGHSPLDPGQIAAKAAAGLKWDYAFKVTLPDAADENDTDTTFYLGAKVLSAKVVPNDSSGVIQRVIMLAINDVVEDPAAAVSGP